jgi:hypothetical protein
VDRTDSGGIVDAKTIMLLQWAALRGPFRGSAAIDGSAAR